MRNLTIRFLIALITFTIGIIIASVWFFYPSRKSESPAKQIAQFQSRNRSEEILRVLMPNGVWGDASQLDRFDRSEEIQVLREAQVEAKGERAISIAFLLAALRDDYEGNRGKLLEALKECARKPYPQKEECTYAIADYLMELCRRGDASLFQPIFDASNNADGAFAQSLGGFYSDMLQEQPEQFLKALAPYPQKKQRELCQSAGIEDGSGMNEEIFRQVSQSLNDLFARPSHSLAPVARTCLVGVRDGYNKGLEQTKSIRAK